MYQKKSIFFGVGFGFVVVNINADFDSLYTKIKNSDGISHRHKVDSEMTEIANHLHCDKKTLELLQLKDVTLCNTTKLQSCTSNFSA